MADDGPDVAEVLRSIDGPRPLRPTFRRRLEEGLLAATTGPAATGTAAGSRPLDRTLTAQLVEALTAPAQEDDLTRLVLADLDRPRPLPSDLSDRLSHRILTERQRRRGALEGPLRERRWERAVAGAAACLLVAGGVAVALHSGPSRHSTAAAVGSSLTTGGAPPSAPAPAAAAAPAPASASGPRSALTPLQAASGAPLSASASRADVTPSAGVATAAPTPPMLPAAPAAEAPAGRPEVQSISPQRGPSTGGTWVTIVGPDLGGATAVRFGTTPAAQIAVNPDGQVRALSPAHLPGQVDVVVVTPQGTTAAGSADIFQFTA